MNKFIAALTRLLGLGPNTAPESSPALDYDQLIHLDAEDLAEAGIKEAYDQLTPILRNHVAEPVEVVETIDNSEPSYSVSCCGVTHDIYSLALSDSEDDPWGRAVYAFFTIVNNQLRESAVKLYAINDGNDLAGMFLTEQQVAAAKKDLENKRDWPYLPTEEPPWYGKYHD